MMQKYLKSILIILGIVFLAWGNTYILYANKRKTEAMVLQVSELTQKLEEAKQKEVESNELLKEAENNLKDLIYRKQQEANAVAKTTNTKPKPAPVANVPIVKPVTVVPVVEKPVVIKVTKPSRSTRAS